MQQFRVAYASGRWKTLMPSIDIRHAHQLEPQRARGIVVEIADAMAKKFSTRHQWQDNTLTFSRPGVNGAITLEADEVHFEAKLGLLLAAKKPAIEREVRRLLSDRFSSVERIP